MSKSSRLLAVVTGTLLLGSVATTTSAAAAQELPNGAPDIAVADVTEHLRQFQTIADNNNGNRATGTSGYRASVDYVAQQAESYGYQVDVRQFNTRFGGSANVIATLPGEDTSTVVMVGAHLDGVSRGPGINDNGSGSAGLLAVAEAFAEADPTPPVTIRFGWWGAEEQGLIGSDRYVDNLSSRERDRIDAYLNFDMIASPNAGYFLYGNDPALRNVLEEYFGTVDVPTEGTDISGRSDHANFAQVGIDVVGLFTGAGATKSQEQARKWGGTAGRAFDPCYHSACDTIDNINDTALERNSDAISYSLWELAGDSGQEPPDDPPADEAPQAGFTVQCQFQSGCTFDASGSTDDAGITGYAWNFGDGTTGNGETAQHTYTGGGSYTATLTVTDKAGQTDTAQRSLRCYDFGTSAFCFPN